MLTLMVIGITAIQVSERADAETGFAARQVVFSFIGLGVFVLMTLVPYQRLGRLSYAMFAVTIILLVGIFAWPSHRGSHRWIPSGRSTSSRPRSPSSA